MKKIILIFIFLLSYISFNELCNDIISIKMPEMTQDYQQIILTYIKQHEGLLLKEYKDVNGYKTIGYGCRTEYFNHVREISEVGADSLCRLSIDRNIKMIQFYFPTIHKPNELYALTHLSYCIGIGSMLKHKLIQNNKLDSVKLKKLNRNLEYSRFEINMFYDN